jgi:hypothetical protein
MHYLNGGSVDLRRGEERREEKRRRWKSKIEME